LDKSFGATSPYGAKFSYHSHGATMSCGVAIREQFVRRMHFPMASLCMKLTTKGNKNDPQAGKHITQTEPYNIGQPQIEGY
jgi:hypothetical protein